jgi:carboxypeptidase family protein
VARARVTVMGNARATTVTDASGAFAFANLPPGPVSIGVDKSTYLNTRYPQAGRTIRSMSKPMLLADGQALEGVTIPMFHGAAISGRVVDANGDPVDFATVSALRVPAPGRVGRPMMRAGTSTDDRGEFRLGRLDSGTYILQATARRGPNLDDTMPGGTPGTPLPQPLPTFYPGVLSIDQAQAIVIEKGQAATDLELVLADGIPGVVIGTVTMSNGAAATDSNIYVNARRVVADGSRSFEGYSPGTGLRPDGTFRLVLGPGDYQLEVRATPRGMNAPRPEDEQFGTVKVSVASGAEQAVAVTVGKGATATGRVIFEGSTPPPSSPPGKVGVPLFSETGECRSGQATIGSDWTFRVEGLAGTCSAPPGGMFGRWMVKAVVVNGENASDAPITFQPDQQYRNVQILVTDKRSEMVFHVADESGQPTRDYVILAYPIQKSKWSTGGRTFVGPTVDPAMAMGRAASSTTPGPTMGNMPARREAMQMLRPGEYYVVAVDDMEPEDPRDPAVLDRLRSSAVRVNIPEGASVDVPLRRISFAAAISNR